MEVGALRLGANVPTYVDNENGGDQMVLPFELHRIGKKK
jgi:hypothetical protein